MTIDRRSLVVGLVVFMLVLSGCAQATPAPQAPTQVASAPQAPTQVVPTAVAPAPAPAPTVQLPPVYQVPRPKPVDTAPPKKFKIAFLGYISNPAIAVTFSGCQSAKAELANVAEVDCITVAETLDAPKMIAAMEDVATKKYDGALLLALNDGVNPSISDAIKAGVKVATYLTEGANTYQTGRTFYLAQDLYGAGYTLGQEMCKDVPANGKVGVITGSFGVTSHELRRHGFLDALAKYCPGVQVVGTFENNDKGDVAFTETTDMLTAHPDLAGVYVTAGGPFGAGQAISDLGLSKQVTVLCFDFVPQTIDLIKEGAIKATIGQDLWGQGHGLSDHDVQLPCNGAVAR